MVEQSIFLIVVCGLVKKKKNLNSQFIVKSSYLIVAKWIWINIDSDNSLLSNGTKPLPKPMLTYQ